MKQAEVTQVSPLRVLLDGASTDSEATVVAFTSPTLSLSDRVFVRLEGGRVYVVGVVA